MLSLNMFNGEDFNSVSGLDTEPNLMMLFSAKRGYFMNKEFRFIILVLLVLLSGFRSASAQTAFATEDELKQQALKLFEDDEFEEAYPLYSQLVSLYPKDPNYNYRLGVCMLYASDDKEKAIPFLEFAATKPEVEKEVIFYLAKAYHLNYRFDDAIAKYLAYSKVASEAKANKLQVDHQIEMCTSGKKLLRNITDLVVIEKKELSRTDFYRAYDISDIGGKLLAKPDEEAFRTPLDKKKKEKSIIYLATNNNQVFFSSYGDDAEHGKDIYVIRKLPNGEWSKPQTLGYPVNTEYDEDYPFLHPNGKVLYFCSKGHNSMGGYDIFKTTLNEETNTWNKPINLDFPINTPDDDILYVTNEDEKEAYFSSARSSKTGQTAVFHINVERKPIDVAIIKGMVIKTKDNQALDVKITIKDLGDNTILGIYNAKETGSYLINLPNGGRFMYTVEATGFNTQSEVVVLPTQYEFKPLKQEISYESGTDKLIIKNLFDEPVDDQSYLLALNFIKEKARLDAGVDAANAAAAKNNSGNEGNNSSQENVAKTDNTSAGNAKITENSTTDNAKTADNNAKSNVTGKGLSNDAIVKIAYDDAKETENEAKDLQEQADIALNIANQKNELAQNKSQEAAQLMADANSMTDNMKKQTALDEANQARGESEELNAETVAAFNIAKKLQQKAAAKDEEADLSTQYAKDLEAAVKSKNPADALEKLKVQEQKLEELSEKNGNAEPDNIYSGLKLDSETKKRELDKAIQTSSDIKQEIADNETLMTSLKSDADNTKKDDVKKGLLDQIEGLKSDNEQSRKELEANEQKVAKLSKEFNGIKNEMELVSNVVDKAKTGTNEDAAASVATINKTKLEQQVNNLKVNTASDNSNSIAKNNAGTTTDNSASNKTNSDNNADNTPTEIKSGNVALNNSDNTSKNNTGKNGSSDKGNSSAVNTADNNGQQNTAGNTVNNNKSSNTSANDVNTSVGNSGDYAKGFTDQLNAAESITDPIEKENKKAELYTNWVAAINDDLGKKQEALKTEKDKTKKKELNSEIASLEKELTIKQDEEKNAIASAEKAKQSAIVAHTGNAASTESGNQNIEGTSSNTVTAADNIGNIAVINQAYSDKLAEAEKITDPAARETEKSIVFKDWSAAITENVDKQKAQLNSSSDPEMKALLSKKISEAEALASEKQSMSAASEDKATTLKQQSTGIASNPNENKTADNNQNSSDTKSGNALAGNNKSNDNAASSGNSNETNSGNTDAARNNSDANSLATSAGQTNDISNLNPSEKLESSLTSANNASNEHDKELKKEEAYKTFISELNDQITTKQTELKTEKSKSKKKELNSEILALQTEVSDKQKLADESADKVTVLENADSEKSSNTVSNSTAETQEKIVYTSAAATQKANAADLASHDAQSLSTRAEDLKTQAENNANQQEKDQLLAQSSDLAKQAEEKNIVAAQLRSEADKTEFIANKDVLDQYAVASGTNKSDAISMAEMMKDESGLYFDKAQKSREMAASLGGGADKLAALEDANKNEKIALDKQRKATEIYKKANPGFVAVVKPVASGTQDNSSQSSGNQTGNSNSADVTLNVNKSAADNSTGNAGIADQKKLSSSEQKNNSDTGNNLAVNENKTNNTISDNSQAGNETNNGSLSNKDKGSDNLLQQKANNNSVKVNDVAANNSGNEVNSDKTNNQDQGSANNLNSADNTSTQNNSNDNSAKANENKQVENNQLENNSSESNIKTNDVAANNNNENSSNEGRNQSKTNSQESNENAKAGNSIGGNDENKSIPDNSSNTSSGNTNVNTSDNNVVATNPGTKIVLAPTEKFQRTDKAVYTAAKPIPVNEKLPEGLVYKVQIGAFRNPISPEQFKGMSPITAETTTQGFTRYTAGLFTKFSTADQVKNEIRQLGYKDAFVVVFLNGKRITVAEALKMQGENPALAESSNASSSNAVKQPNTNTGANTTAANTSTANSNSAEAGKTNIAASENVSGVGGLFYTVQVGVYSQQVSSAKLHNIQPLYAESMPNGNIRYNTGIYNSVSKANEARNIVVNAGIKDAFVTAYYQGKRISLNEAATLSAQGNTVFSNVDGMNQLPSTSGKNVSPAANNSNSEKISNATNENLSVSPVKRGNVNESPVNKQVSPASTGNSELNNTIQQNNTMPVDSGLVFKVQIGAFKDEVPLEIANQFLKIAGKGIKNYRDEHGLTIYTLGSFKTYDEASQLKAEITSIVNDAFIVAYNNGHKISVDEAKNLQK